MAEEGLDDPPLKVEQRAFRVKDKDERPQAPKRTWRWCTASVYAEAVHCWEVFLG